MDLSIHEKRVFSQNGEDGITAKIIELIYDGNNEDKFFVEFGVQDGKECNTRLLRECYGWKGLQMDGGYFDDSINLRQEWITQENITRLFQKYNVPKTINLLSVDIDFNDFFCLKEILSVYKCDIIICEYNATHAPDEDKVVVYDENGKWDGTNYFGASLLSLTKLAMKYDYSLVYCDNRGVNCFFIHDDIIKRKELHFKDVGNVKKIYNPPRYGNGPNGGHPHDPQNRKYVSFDEAANQ